MRPAALRDELRARLRQLTRLHPSSPLWIPARRLGRIDGVARLALISDVHAPQTALAHLDRLGVDRILCAGDLLDYGLFPEETLDLLRARAIPSIRGNHDRWAVHRTASGRLVDRSGWALGRRALRFLADLPTSWEATIEGVRVAMHHARPGRDMAGIEPAETSGAEQIVEPAGADVLIVGHTHVSFRLPVAGGRAIVNPGSLLCNPAAEYAEEPIHEGAIPPRRGGGTFGILELPTKNFTVYAVGSGRPRPSP